MVKVVVTGGHGLVGKALQQVTKDFNFIFLSSKECDLRNYQATLELFKQIKPDVIVHLAANVGGLYKNINYKVEMFEDNLILNTNVVKCAYLSGVKRLIGCLSTCVFPDNISPLNETNLHQGPPHESNEGYAYAKRMLELQCRLYNENCGTNYSVIIPTNIYGYNDNYNLEDSHVVPGLIHRCYLAKRNGLPFIIRGTGSPLRQFVYSTDLAKIILLMLNTDFKGNLVISPSQEYSIKQIAEIIAEKFGCSNLTFDNTFSDGQYRKTADNSKLKLVFPNFEFTDLKTGISQTIDYFIKNYENLKK